jgi:hypothetical protein
MTICYLFMYQLAVLLLDNTEQQYTYIYFDMYSVKNVLITMKLLCNKIKITIDLKNFGD